MSFLRFTISVAFILLFFISKLALMVPDSHAYSNTDVTDDSVSLILDFSEMFLSLEIGFSLPVVTAVFAFGR